MREAERIQSEASTWIIRRDAGLWSSQDQQNLGIWLASSVAHRVSYLRLDAAWKRADQLEVLRESVKPAKPAPFKSPWRLERSWRNLPIGLLTLCLVAMIGYRGLMTMQPAGILDAQFNTQIGDRQVVNLADGSHLTLNTNTQLRTKFNNNQRRVWLDRGEVFFDVAHDASRPFIIMAGDQRVRVLGTRFSVRRDKDDVIVSVSSGRVEVVPNVSKPDSDLNAEVIRDNDALAIHGEEVIRSIKTPQQMKQALAWQQGRLIADNLPLGTIAAEFNRYNNKQISIDPAVANLQIACNFELRNVDAFTAVLREGLGLKITVKGNQVSISK